MHLFGIDGDTVYIASSDELFAYTPEFDLIDTFRNPYLKHCHEIAMWKRKLFLTSTGFDAILEFDLDRKRFDRGIHVALREAGFTSDTFDPNEHEGPGLADNLHLNSVFCDENGMYASGMRSRGMVHIDGDAVGTTVDLPPGTHNARPFRNGVIFNDTNADLLRYCGREDASEDRAMAVPRYDVRQLKHTDLDDNRIARQGFARGLCVLSDTIVAGGSSPSTVTIWDLEGNAQLSSINLTMDIRSAIHCLAVWPF